MCAATPSTPLRAPIFVIADTDREALDRLLVQLDSERFYLPISEPRRIIRYASGLAVTAVFIADDIPYPNGGAARLLQVLLDEVGKPVVVMCDAWTPETAERWKRMGASDCVPHPTRCEHRMDQFREKLLALELADRESRGVAGPEERTRT